MRTGALHAADDREATQVWPAVRSAHLFDSWERFERFYAEAPWRVQVTGREEAVVLERWRTHLDVLAIRGMWCAGHRIPDLVRGIARLASGQGYGRVLSPLVSEDVAADYERAGMRRHSVIRVLKYDRRRERISRRSVPNGVAVRPALPDDVADITLLDAQCFDEFWRYDADRVVRYLMEDRIVVAEEAGRIIGYTLCTLLRDSGTVGRLAVAPAERRRGIGSALLSEALDFFDGTGAGSVSLCTQEENRVSQELYRQIGLTELSGRLVFLVRPAEGDPGE